MLTLATPARHPEPEDVMLEPSPYPGQLRWAVCRLLVAALLLASSTATPIRSQTVDSIKARPGAVALRSIFSLRGNGAGAAVTSLWDLNADGRVEFGVMEFSTERWIIFGIDSAHIIRRFWESTARSPDPLFHGDFRGDGHPMLVYPWVRDTAILGRLSFLDFFTVDSGRIADTPSMTWQSRSPGIRLIACTFQVADLDLDGSDELIVASVASNRDGVSHRGGEIWIYRGGPDFQIDTPSVVIRDSIHNGSDYDLHIGRVDADEYPDLVCVTLVDTRIRWGGRDMARLDRPVDRSFAGPSQFLNLLDVDGDKRSDFLWDGVYIHRSDLAKDPRTRAFDFADADHHFVGRGALTFVLGPLNDSAARWDMFGLNSALGDGAQLFFAGSSRGPDRFYDAYFIPQQAGLPAGNVFGSYRSPAGDIDGNGWRDFITGSASYSGGGIALILAGGPYIPRDSMPASAIRDIEVGAHRDAITIWPNPADNVVHIAWRGDLSRTPARFAVHDMLGRLVAHGAADVMRGEVLWSCDERSAGAYLLAIYDARNDIIATATIIKR
jgi:hypothetical protein